MQELIKKLNAPTAEERLSALEMLVAKQTEKPVKRDNDANNHIHTIYSFSLNILYTSKKTSFSL